MKLRKSTIFTCLTVINVLVLLLLMAQAQHRQKITIHSRTANRALVEKLLLTDLCIFTEARYTRHPAMADHHAPFQEHPTALDHFPSGSMLLPVESSARIYAEKP